MPEHGRVPKYYAVKARLLALMPELGPDAPLPPERELAADYGVSRATVRQAISELVLEGRLAARQGRGTFVAAPKLIHPLDLVSYTEAVRAMGRTPSRILVTKERVTADAGTATVLGVEEGTDVLHLERVLLTDGEPTGLESTYLPAARFPDLLDTFDPAGSLYACLQDEHGVVFAEAEDQIETALASPREAHLLGTNPALPMLLLHRVSYDPEGAPIERVRTLYRGDRIGFRARLRAG
ncbi:GntR family transcriptional regulator [Actinorhabdospora filicis]|uniref:GntR family transcriptional regulator n=1 Tax=Actinorhabdospora filicis TaxID=1785913 RepID=UPI00255707BE|nr:GntR family transcriptional regulator [Actinorhabdospora filicis]